MLGRRDGNSAWHRVFASARSRILASYLVLLLFSTVVGTLALRELLLARAGDRVDDALVQETEEFQRLARDGRDPRTGEPFGDDLEAIFDVFLSRNVPGEREAFFTYVDGVLYSATFAPGLPTERIAAIDDLGDVSASRRRRAGGRRRPPDPLPGAAGRARRPLARGVHGRDRPVGRDRGGQRRDCGSRPA